jgi:hypothetical protein
MFFSHLLFGFEELKKMTVLHALAVRFGSACVGSACVGKLVE